MAEHMEIYKGYKIVIKRDSEPMDPDFFYADTVFMITKHRQFSVSPKKSVVGKIDYKNLWGIPLYAYIHSGVHLSLTNTTYPFNDLWDSGIAGEVFVRRDSSLTPTLEKAMEIAQDYVDCWNYYLSGDVWGFTIEDEQGILQDSAYGYYVDDLYKVLPEAHKIIDEYTKDPDLVAPTTWDRPMVEHEAEYQEQLILTGILD